MSDGAQSSQLSFALGVDIDEEALAIAGENLDDLEISDTVDLVQAAVSSPREGSSALDRLTERFDTVVMNPPFGTKQAGLDTVFLERACQIASCAVYSLHKSTTRDHIARRAKEFGFEGQVLAKMRYDLPKTMRFHKQASKDIEVDFWRLARRKST